ncbi:MAG: hypothetical protein H0U76_18610 [Ktedonobacteraceae bacterium]|nr:hypothetical protein [Ktedonobacteraceae bacterium]
MAFNKNKYRGADLRNDVRALSEDCRRAAGKLAARVRSGRAGYGARGRVEALTRMAGWLERIVGNSLMLIDLATNINDCILCLQQCVEDEQSDTCPAPGRYHKQLDTYKQHQLMAMARGKAGAFAEVADVLSHLLTVHYPGRDFPLTLAAGRLSHDEWKRLVEPDDISIEEEVNMAPDEGILMFEAFEPLPHTVSEYERQLLSQVESALLQGQDRIIVLTEIAMGNTKLTLTCIDRLLRCAPGCRVLVLVGRAELKPSIMHAFTKVMSLADGKHLSELYRFQERPTAYLEDGTQICFSTLREMQALLPRPADGGEQDDPAQKPLIPSDDFDIIVVYGEPSVHAQYMWQYVLEYFQVPYHIGFCGVLDPFLLSLFEWNVVCSEPLREKVAEQLKHMFIKDAISTATDSALRGDKKTAIPLVSDLYRSILPALISPEDEIGFDQSLIGESETIH